MSIVLSSLRGGMFVCRWQPYNVMANRLVEEAYQEFLKSPGSFDVRAVKSGNTCRRGVAKPLSLVL